MSIKTFIEEISSRVKAGDMSVYDTTTTDRHGISYEEGRKALQKYIQEITEEGKRLQADADGLELRLIAIRQLKSLGETIRTMKSKTWREVTDFMETNFPTMYNGFYPRRFEIPAGYTSPKRLCAPALHAIWALSKYTSLEGAFVKSADTATQDSPSARHAFKICAELSRLSVPTYFVSRACMSALINTDLPKDFQLQELPWPMDAMVFVLPDGILKSPEGDITLISVVRCQRGASFSMPWLRWDAPSLDERITTETLNQGDQDTVAILGLTETCRLYHWECPLDTTSIHDAQQVKAFGHFVGGEKQQVTTTEEEQFTTHSLSETAFQVILAMLAAPEMIEAGVLVREEKHKKGKTQSALWRPNFFGRAYRRYDEIVGSGGEAQGQRRVHWRRGHFRHQRFGPGNASIRVLWIKPTLIGKDKMAA